MTRQHFCRRREGSGQEKTQSSSGAPVTWQRQRDTSHPRSSVFPLPPQTHAFNWNSSRWRSWPRPRSLIQPATYSDLRTFTSINFIPRVKIGLSLSTLSHELSQLGSRGDPSRWAPILSVRFLTCWFYEILWVPLVSSLPRPGTSQSARSPGTF